MALAFAPFGQTFVIAADSTAPTGIQVTRGGRSNTKEYCEYMIVNSGSLIVHLGWGGDAATATANAVAATAGTPKNSLPIMPNSVQILRFGVDTYFSGYSASANSIYITIGEGL